MTGAVRFALLADGRSDRALLPIIRWTLVDADPAIELAQPGFRPRDLGKPLLAEIDSVCDEFEPEILFVHRDAEREPLEARRREIPDVQRSLVRVVPVRMTEAWLLFDLDAIRAAAGNPKGRARLDLPPPRKIEALPDPKDTLHRLLVTASEARGRRLKAFRRDLPATVHRVAELVRDFGSLRLLPAFTRFEADCRDALAGLRSGG